MVKRKMCWRKLKRILHDVINTLGLAQVPAEYRGESGDTLECLSEKALEQWPNVKLHEYWHARECELCRAVLFLHGVKTVQ